MSKSPAETLVRTLLTSVIDDLKTLVTDEAPKQQSSSYYKRGTEDLVKQAREDRLNSVMKSLLVLAEDMEKTGRHNTLMNSWMHARAASIRECVLRLETLP